jgi:hypothetical protein
MAKRRKGEMAKRRSPRSVPRLRGRGERRIGRGKTLDPPALLDARAGTKSVVCIPNPACGVQFRLGAITPILQHLPHSPRRGFEHEHETPGEHVQSRYAGCNSMKEHGSAGYWPVSRSRRFSAIPAFPRVHVPGDVAIERRTGRALSARARLAHHGLASEARSTGFAPSQAALVIMPPRPYTLGLFL